MTRAATTLLRMRDDIHSSLQEQAALENATMQDVLERALEAYRRAWFLDGVNADFAALRADPAAWEDLQRERAEWDATLMDDIDPE